jgi:voltage-gated potassium channel
VRPRFSPRRYSRLEERAAKAVVSRRVFPLLAGATVVLAVGVGFLVRAIAPNDFHSFGEGIWWAVVTLATVGYGDVVPTSPWGRVVGGVVIVLGVTFLAFLTATVTSLFVSSEQREAARQEEERRAASEEEMKALLREVSARLEALEARLDEGTKA